MTEQADKYRQAAEQMNRLADLDEEEEEVKDTIEEQLDTELKSIFSDSYIMSEHEEITKLSSSLNINASDARKKLASFPNEYIVQDHTIPDLVRKMRKSRRALKGEHRTRMSKAIDTMIDAYTDHLNKCISSITWLNDYETPLRKMRYNEKDLSKLHKMKSSDLRRETIDALCKYWEAELEQTGMPYNQKYSELHKTMSSAKRDFRNTISKITDQSLTKSKRERKQDFILKTVCENPGINASAIHERMPTDLHKSSSPNSISKAIKKLDITSIKGSYYKVPSMIKKNIWAYTAAFIDSDGYITLDRNMNPRVGLVATGERGKAFMQEMHKSLGFGRMHLDQKSPQATRLINRLNFYSQDDVSKLLVKCLPHFRLKKGNAKLLLELIRMKKSYKKAEWYKGRCDEIFKLMKWENHKDHVGFDWSKENINLEDIQKYTDNCKMSVMDSLENIGTIIKSEKVEIRNIRLDDDEETMKEDFTVSLASLHSQGLPIDIEQNSWSQNYDVIQEYLEKKYKSLIFNFDYNIVKSSTPYLRDKKGLGDKEVEHIISTTKKLLENKPEDLDDEGIKIFKELKLADIMLRSQQNYSYAIGRMQKYIKLYIEKYGNIGL
tara:strand:+ start:5129 stop:6952 length:1824 start_codon:yes stop_codon:yes gene_type:complete